MLSVGENIEFIREKQKNEERNEERKGAGKKTRKTRKWKM